MARRKRTPWKKRCACRTACTHADWLQVRVGRSRQWVNLTERFPEDTLTVAAAKAREMAKAGLAATLNTVATVADVARLYRAGRTCSHDVYVDLFVKSPALSGGVIGDKKMDAVTTAEVKHACGKRVRDAKRHFLQSARHLFHWAIDEGHATRTPFKTTQGVVIIKVPKSRERDRRLEAGEEDRIRAVGDAYINDFVTAMLSTGCRPGELRTLQWSEVKDDHFVVLAEKAKDRETRKIPILPDVRAILDRRKLGPDGAELPSDTYAFGDDTGRMLSRERLCARWRAVCAKAKIVNLHLHDLRGEFASQMAEADVPLYQVRDALGHSSLTMTNTYLRSRVSSVREGYEQLQRRRSMSLVKGAKQA